MAQDGVFQDDLEVSGIAVLYEEFLSLAADVGEGFQTDDLVIPSQRISTESPVVIGNGPVDFTTCTDLARVYPPYHVWDVEGYYHALGVHHLATRRDLRRAFLAKDGHDSERLTYVVKTLLDPVLRHDYDLQPLGARWLQDPWVQDDIKRRAHQEARWRTMHGYHTTGDDVLNEWGFKYVEDPISPLAPIGNDSDERLSEADIDGQDGVVNDAWCYSFYAWRTTKFDAPLRAWQEALIRAAANMGLTTKMAVGVIGESELPWVIENIHGRQVVLIGDGIEPSNSLATQAIAYLTQLI
jgi:hypothetical protein